MMKKIFDMKTTKMHENREKSCIFTAFYRKNGVNRPENATILTNYE